MQDYSGKWKAERERAAFLALADGSVFRAQMIQQAAALSSQAADNLQKQDYLFY